MWGLPTSVVTHHDYVSTLSHISIKRPKCRPAMAADEREITIGRTDSNPPYNTSDDFEHYVPSNLTDLLEASSQDLRSRIPELARDEHQIETINTAISDIPTGHKVYCRDSRDLSIINDESVQLIISSPPYFDLKYYDSKSSAQLGDTEDYTKFIQMLDSVWQECSRVLVPGGRMAIVVGDVLRSRREHGRHRILPLHAEIQQSCSEHGLDVLAPIYWYKIGNTSLESGGKSGFLGKPYEPGAVIKNDVEYILLFRKLDGYRSPTTAQRILSVLGQDRHQRCFQQVWTDIQGVSDADHPAPFPELLAERLIRMFSFVGDTVLDPFAGSGTTAVAASQIGRNSVSIDVSEKYANLIQKRITDVQAEEMTLKDFCD